MPTIKYIEHSGVEHVVEVEAGQSVMEGAVKSGVPGIDADCGGACACATCHVYVDEAWLARAGKPGEIEASMLDFAENVQHNSRLSCQVKCSSNLDGMIVRMPKASTDAREDVPTALSFRPY